MPQTLIRPPRTILEVWENLPEGTLCQLINNELIISPAPKEIHQSVLNRINVKIFNYAEKAKIGEVRISPYDVHFSKQNILQPDLIFIKSENLYRIEEKGLVGPPDIVIEILSISTSNLDYERKKLIYERFGVVEYFLVDPNTRSVDSFFLKDGIYEEQKTIIGKIDSEVLGTKISF